jgi:hypothetical protein
VPRFDWRRSQPESAARDAKGQGAKGGFVKLREGMRMSELVGRLREANIGICLAVDPRFGGGGLANSLAYRLRVINWAVKQRPHVRYLFGNFTNNYSPHENAQFSRLFSEPPGRGCRLGGGDGRTRGQMGGARLCVRLARGETEMGHAGDPYTRNGVLYRTQGAKFSGMSTLNAPDGFLLRDGDTVEVCAWSMRNDDLCSYDFRSSRLAVMQRYWANDAAAGQPCAVSRT